MKHITLLLVALILCNLAPAEEALDIGSRREVFFDNHLISSMTGVSLRLGHPVERESVLHFDNAWEGRYSGYITILHHDGKYRMYYRGLPEARKDGSDSEVTCYAESADGIAWTKPGLGIHKRDGNAANNIVLQGQAPFSHNFAPFVDTRPEVPSSERYKAIAGTSDTGLHGFISEDGLHWSKLDTPIITEGAFDSQNVAFWSESEQVYVCYFRTWSKGGYDGYRSVSRASSKDFREWTAPLPMEFGGTPMEHLYTNQTQSYYRAPHISIALAARFMPGRRVVDPDEATALGVEAQYSGDCSDSVFMSSRGGTRYDRTFMEGFIKPGLNPRDWTSRTNYPACGVVPTGVGEMSFYVQRDYGQPSVHLVRYTLRPDGFVSAWAPYGGGELLTKPLRFEGETLRLNFATSAAGELRVQLEDTTGNALPEFTFDDCEPLIGNALDKAVRWKDGATMKSLAGTPIQVRFQMKDAELYALRFASKE